MSGRCSHGQVGQQVSQDCARFFWGRVLGFRKIKKKKAAAQCTQTLLLLI